MRTSALFVLALSLVACDSSVAGDELLGSWSLSTLDAELLVTSQTAQSIPDLTTEPAGSVSVRGALDFELRYFAGVSESSQRAQISVSSENPATAAGQIVRFTATDIRGETAASLFDGPNARTFDGSFSDTPPFTRAGPAFTVPRMELRNSAGEAAIVRGTLTFPEIALPAGQPTTVPQEDLTSNLAESITFVFGEEGRFSATVEDGGLRDELDGTWEAFDNGQVRVVVSEGGPSETLEFSYRIDGGALVLVSTTSESECNGTCRAINEQNLFAEPGSFSAVVTELTYRFSRTPGAAARTAPDDRAPAARIDRSVPIIGRLVPETTP